MALPLFSAAKDLAQQKIFSFWYKKKTKSTLMPLIQTIGGGKRIKYGHGCKKYVLRDKLSAQFVSATVLLSKHSNVQSRMNSD